MGLTVLVGVIGSGEEDMNREEKGSLDSFKMTF